ncbi:phosphoesterase RecJ domain protein [Methanococcus vannielii SB]|uniref:Phosphoesterase RecJ domain protein n=1 Tax=Methanococcus vannielii (strain ATCC 35089 / DSM 1224 / JCM 13029 / OCM 148 / SB) TaxID=406327 RepID=A6USX1_METVS|nr:DHH family phosphoesterase [Methanococcus vannielii]ABR55593.1 phosphoesterase RecJ domain protein [Methanococcus vannielii SB]
MEMLHLNDVSKFNELTAQIKDKIEKKEGLIRIITHHDTDGLTAGFIILKTLYRLNKTFQMTILEQLTKENLEKLSLENKDNLYIFCDMGSGQSDIIENLGFDAIILDHHPPTNFEAKFGKILQLNAHIIGSNGSKEISASGICYLVARTFGYYDLAPIAIIGAIGDMQHKPFLGLNKYILNEARKNRYLSVIKDSVYNCYNLPISKAIYYSTQPYIRELNTLDAINLLLDKIEINSKKNGTTVEESEKMFSELQNYVKIEELCIDKYNINHNLKDGFYISEVLNSCGRMELTSTAIGILLGDEECIKQGENAYITYKEELVLELQKIKILTLENIEYFIGDKGKTGIMASLMVKNKPVFGFSENGEYYKVSSRGNSELVRCGLNLSEVMKISKKYGGDGGGHDIASGGIIQKAYLTEFLNEVDKLVTDQLKK